MNRKPFDRRRQSPNAPHLAALIGDVVTGLFECSDGSAVLAVTSNIAPIGFLMDLSWRTDGLTATAACARRPCCPAF